MEDDVIELLVIAMVHYTTIRQMLSNLPAPSAPSFVPSFPDGPTPMIPIQSYAFGIQESLPLSPDRQPFNQSLLTLNQLPSATFSYSLDGSAVPPPPLFLTL
jgi:hypothetical protein